MNNTPETDKAERMAYSQEYMVDTEFARKLERERDEAREKAERYRREANKFMLQRDESQEKYATEATEHMLAVNKLCNERDEAQADCLEQARLLGMGSEREARLISERDEALSQIVQAECRAERFCQERDDARIDAQKSKAYKRVLKETNLRQTERIRYLEGATNHACGTPLSVALRERDEAKNEILVWENKWKCAVDMAARSEIERDDALNKLKELKDILR